ncbi:hypothetical protein [uncultured Roseobacter sp.]|uniref:hypothetical protein n=1 Tax=uncultured Roseobacter sp. TaxID=114847 RepID=UPI002639DDF3|nr:hypothetical protein [uncultured Roseobacter sp.]
MRGKFKAALAVMLAPLALPAAASEGTRIQVTGEIIDTWCYYSGVMGGPDAVVGSAHHTCALWCSAGGIPVGLLAEDGTVYMVLKIEQDAGSASGDTQLSLAAHTVTADGMLYERDGLNYLVVSEVISDMDIVNTTHEDYGTVPPFSFPDPNK